MSFAVTVLTMFPGAFPGALGVSLIGSAWREQGLWRLETVDIRGFSTDKRGFLDDTPAGGGPGHVHPNADPGLLGSPRHPHRECVRHWRSLAAPQNP